MSDPPRPGPSDPSRAFRERARWEADRYGADPWVFVRELLQNARDAGAHTVEIAVEEDDNRSVIRCTDDGEGMSFEHARRYLFSLYASSKENDGSQVGKFGVGFWSVLRFEPERITVRSRQRDGSGWGLTLSGDLARAHEVDPPEHPGTEVILERAGGDGMLARRIRDAAHQNGRFLCRRDDPEAELPVTVNGQSINEAFELPAPRSSFHRGDVRGVVALGPAPRVELFSRGLRVRSAAALEDLLSANTRTDRSRVAFPEIPGGMAPQAILECPELELLLSRGDARDDRKLRKLVRLAQKELERLVDQQLAHARSRRWWQRAADQMLHGLRYSLAWQTGTAAVAGVPVALVVAKMLAAQPAAPTPTTGPPPSAPTIAAAPTEPFPYTDLSSRYGGPQVDTLDATPAPFQLSYSPPDRELYLAALRFDRFMTDGTPVAATGDARPYPFAPCGADCVQIQLTLAGGDIPVRLPVPTGMGLAAPGVLANGVSIPVHAGPDGLPIVTIEPGVVSQVTYSVGPTTERAPVVRAGARLPPDWDRVARRARRVPREQRVLALTELLSRHIRYDRTVAVAGQHEAARLAGQGFLDRAHGIAAGDCDIQNGALAAVLQVADVPARLAVGMVARDGGPSPWLHAWVEYRGEDGQWRVVDASAGAAPEAGASPVAAAPEVDAAAPPVPVTGPPSFGDPPPDGGSIASVSDATAPPRWLRPVWLLGGGIGLVLLGLGLRGRTRRSTVLDRERDVSALIEGALQHPAAFRHLPGLYTRPLVPTLGGRHLSLRRARTLSTRGRLYQSANQAPLAARAARRGAAVLDGDRPEGATVARAMGAVDLDRWDRLIGRSRTTPFLQEINDELRAMGEGWCLRQVPEAPGGLSSLDVGRLGARVRGEGATRVTLIDALDPVLREARELAETRPRTARFLLVERIVERMRLPPRRRAELLSELGRAALEEETS